MKNVTSRYDSFVFGMLLLLTVGLPVFFFPYTFNRFDLPKGIFLVSVAVVLIVLWAFQALSGRLVWNRTAVDLPVLLFLFAVLISSILSLNVLESWVGSSFATRKEPLPVWISYLIVFFAASNYLTDDASRKKLIKGLLLVSLPVSAFAVVQSFGIGLFYPDRPAQLQVSSTLGNPIYAAGYLSLVVPLALGVLMSGGNRRGKILWAVAAVLAVIALILTYNRGGWLGAGVGVLAFLALALVAGARRERRRWVVFIVVTLALVLFGLLSLQTVAPRTLSILYRTASGFELGGTALKRALILKSTLPLIEERPLFGWGPETYRDVFAKYQDPRLVELAADRPMTADRPHSQLMYITYAFGLLGLFAYLWIITSSMGKAWKAVVDTSGEQFLLIGLASSIFGYLVQEQFSFSSAAVTPFFWMFLGITGAASVVRPVSLSVRLSKSVRISLKLVLGIIAFGLIILFTRAALADSFYHLGRTYSAQGSLKDGVKQYSRAIYLNPFESAFRFSYGVDSRVLSLQTEDVAWIEDALPIVREGLRQNPLSSDLYFVLGELYFASSFLQGHADYSDAREAYLKAIRASPNYSYAYLGMGLSFLQEGKDQEAIPYFNRAVSITPGLWQAWNGLGQAHAKMGRVSEAIRDYEKTLEINPDYQPAREELMRLRADGQI